jgi:PEGA domain
MRTPRAPAAIRLALVALLASLLTSSLAFGSGVVVIVGGDADTDTRRKLASAVEQGLGDHREEPRQIAFDAAEVNALVGCVSREASKECASDFMRSRTDGASRAIVLSVARDGRANATITGWVLARDGTILVIDQGVCDACTPAKLKDVTMELLAVLLREVEARMMPTILAVRTTPSGAQVEIDGRIVGESNAQRPLEYRVYAGAHRIVVQLRGYETAIRSVQVVAGETRPIEVELVALPGTLKPAASASQPAIATSPHHQRTRWGAWLTLGAGAIAASTGIALIIADQDASRSPDVTQPYDRRETMTLGIVSASLGAAAVGAGLWWLRRDTGPSRRNAAPAVHVAPSSAVLLYTRTF